MGINVQADLVVHEVKVYATGVNISAYSPAGKDPNGEWRVNPWLNLRPTRAIQDFAQTLKKGDRIHAEGFVGAYLPKQKGAETPKVAQYVVVQKLSMQEPRQNTQPAATYEPTQPAANYGDDNELPF